MVSEVLQKMAVEVLVVWDVTPFVLVFSSRPYTAIRYPNLQGRTSRRQPAEKSVTSYQTTQLLDQEDGNFRVSLCLRSHSFNSSMTNRFYRVY